MEYFDFVKKVNYEGEQSSNPFAFKFYDPDRVILGKKMSEHLPFAMAWWHNLGASGADMFGVGTADKSFGAAPGTMAQGQRWTRALSSCKSSESNISASTMSI